MITKEMTIEDILNRFPARSQKLAQLIKDAGLNCVGCNSSSYETLEVGMLSHGFENEEIESLVKKLNAILEEELDPTTITLSKEAAEAFKEIATSQGFENAALRLDCIPGGCSGYQYELEFSEGITADDKTFESNGVEIHIHKNKIHLLMGCKVDYHVGLDGAGFKISNPNAKSSCACGKSQSY